MISWDKRSDDKAFRILFFSSSARDFFVSLFGVFFPIFLLVKGFSLAYVLVYFLIRYLVGCFGVYPFMKIISKFGLKKTFIFACVMAVPFYSLLYFADFLILNWGSFVFLGILILFDKLGDTTYWYAYHLLFSECNNKKNLARHLGEISSFSSILLLASPFIGGLLISFFSFNVVLIIVLTFLIISLCPLFFIDYPKVPANFSLRDIFCYEFVKRNKVYFVEGVYGSINKLLWPIYLYFMNFSFVFLGLFATLIKVVQSGTVYLLGYFIGKNKKKDNSLSKVGLFFVGLGVLLRGVFSNLYGLFFAQSISALGNPFFNMPIIQNLYERSQKNPVLSIIGRELFLNIGRVVFVFIFLIFVLVFEQNDLPKLFIGVGLTFIVISLIRKIVFIYSSG